MYLISNLYLYRFLHICLYLYKIQLFYIYSSYLNILSYIIYLNSLSISAALVAKPSPGCQCGSLCGTSISLCCSTSCSSSSSKMSLKVNAKLCSTAQTTTIAVEQINLLLNPLDRHGNLRFQIPNVLSTI